MTRKRLFAYLIDVISTVIASGILIYISLILVSIFTLVFLPFIVENERFWNDILFFVHGVSLVAGFSIVLVLSFRIIKRFRRTLGYKTNRIGVKNPDSLLLFAKWLLQHGILAGVLFMIAYLRFREIDASFLIYVFYIYLIYQIVDGVVLLSSNGKATWTDKWLGIEAIE